MEYFTHVWILFVLSLVREICASDQSYALCGGQKGFIRCLKGTRIQIVTASYGRTDPTLCPFGKTDTRTCRSKTSELKVRWNCNGYRTCHLQATDQNFGDPCPNYSKYLEVKYRCVKTPNLHLTEKTIIAFNAYITKTLNFTPNTRINVVYDGIYLNRGLAYNRHSGFFTAPSDGLYIFTWTSLVSPNTIFDSEILVNGIHKGYSNCNNHHNKGHGNCANTVPLLLKSGDKVNIRSTIHASNLIQNWSSFKGWKV